MKNEKREIFTALDFTLSVLHLSRLFALNYGFTSAENKPQRAFEKNCLYKKLHETCHRELLSYNLQVTGYRFQVISFKFQVVI